VWALIQVNWTGSLLPAQKQGLKHDIDPSQGSSPDPEQFVMDKYLQIK
jgi:hypothetical protein